MSLLKYNDTNIGNITTEFLSMIKLPGDLMSDIKEQCAKEFPRVKRIAHITELL